jgi:hypothetical protein
MFEDFIVTFPGCLWGWAIAEAIVEKVPFFILSPKSAGLP